MTRLEAPGVYYLDAETYHKDPAPEPSLSSSGAREIMASCPAIYWYNRQNNGAKSHAMEMGQIAHRLVLEGVAITETHFIVSDGFSESYTKQCAEEIAELQASGKPWLKQRDADAINAMADALARHSYANFAFEGGRPETSIFWIDPDFGIWCRCRPDYMPRQGRIFVDYKSMIDISDEGMARAFASFGYAQQAAWYMDGIVQAGLEADPLFLFVCQMKSPPYLVRTVLLNPEDIERGRALNYRAKNIFANCLRTGRWPGFADDIETVSLPRWERKRIDDLGEAGKLAIEFQAPMEHAT